MIYINNELFTPDKFPDGTYRLSCPVDFTQSYSIDWFFDNESECMLLYYLVHHIREHNEKPYISLYLPYIPNARMDRVKTLSEVFTLKWFARFLNDLHFDVVYVHDPHSNVSTALIDRVYPLGISKDVRKIITDLSSPVLCFPDSGAAKKYSDQFSDLSCVCCSKNRDWATGKILSLTLSDPETVKGKIVLITDDICSRGGTFMMAAQALKEAGADKVYLYVTHCENTIFEGELLSSNLIEQIYTTNSIYRGEHPKITII